MCASKVGQSAGVYVCVFVCVCLCRVYVCLCVGVLVCVWCECVSYVCDVSVGVKAYFLKHSHTFVCRYENVFRFLNSFFRSLIMFLDHVCCVCVCTRVCVCVCVCVCVEPC